MLPSRLRGVVRDTTLLEYVREHIRNVSGLPDLCRPAARAKSVREGSTKSTHARGFRLRVLLAAWPLFATRTCRRRDYSCAALWSRLRKSPQRSIEPECIRPETNRAKGARP